MSALVRSANLSGAPRGADTGAWGTIAPRTQPALQPSCTCRTALSLADLRLTAPDDAYEREADSVASRVMRPAPPEHELPIAPTHRTASIVQRKEEDEKSPAQPSQFSMGVGVLMSNLARKNPEVRALPSRLANRFLSQPAGLSVGLPVFVGSQYAVLWTLAIVDPSMRRHVEGFDLAMLPGVVPQFPVKKFKYRILDPEEQRFSFELGLDASGLLKIFNEGVLDTRVSKLGVDLGGQLATESARGIDLSTMQVKVGLFDNALKLSGGYRQGLSPDPIRFPAPTAPVLGDLPGGRLEPMRLPGRAEQRDVRFMIEVDLVRLLRHPRAGSARSTRFPAQQGRATSIQRKPGKEGRDPAPAAEIAPVLAARGQPLDGATRHFMEDRIGHDFSRVRVHADTRAAASAAAVRAKAYTVGSDVVFARGQYSPQTPEGRRLLAHELTHVVQQGAGAPIDRAPARGGGSSHGSGVGTRVVHARSVDTQMSPTHGAWVLQRSPAPRPVGDEVRPQVESLLTKLEQSTSEEEKDKFARRAVNIIIEAYRLSRKGLRSFRFDPTVTEHAAVARPSLNRPGESVVLFGPATFSGGFAFLVHTVAHELEHVAQNRGRAYRGRWREDGMYRSFAVREFLAYSNTVLQAGPPAVPAERGLLTVIAGDSTPTLPAVDAYHLAFEASMAMQHWERMSSQERSRWRQQFYWVRDKLLERLAAEAPEGCRPPATRSGPEWTRWLNDAWVDDADPLSILDIPECGDWEHVKDAFIWYTADADPESYRTLTGLPEMVN